MDQVVTNRDLWQVIFRFLCHFDIARFAQINRMLQTCVETFFKNTKTLIIAFPHRVNTTQMLQWPLLRYIQHLDIASLCLDRSMDRVIDWPCTSLLTLRLVCVFPANSTLRLHDMRSDLSGAIRKDRSTFLEPFDMIPETLQVHDHHERSDSDGEPEPGGWFDDDIELLIERAANEYDVEHPVPNELTYKQEKRQRLMEAEQDMRCVCLWERQ